MARIVAEKSESSFSQVIHSAGVPRLAGHSLIASSSILAFLPSCDESIAS
jgi:hypothetical protein